MVDSIRVQQSTTVRFSYTADLTWGKTALQVRSTNVILSCLAGAQFADCITCLTTLRILFQFQHTIAFLLFHKRLSLYMFEHVSFLCFIHLLFLHPSVLPKALQGNPPIHFLSPGQQTTADCIACITTNNFVSV